MSESEKRPSHSMIGRLSQALQRWRRAKALARAREARILAATERLVDEIDPRLRGVSGYRKKLRQAVETTLSYTTDIVNMIPGPVAVDSRSWSENPMIRAFFSGPEELRRLFSKSEEIREFFDHRAILEPDHCYAMLSMTYRERTILGTELDGEMIKREVKQTSVSFDDMRVVEPGMSEYELRENLSERAFEVLTGYALQQITDLKLSQAELQEQRQLVETQLRLAKVKTSGLETLLERKPAQVSELRNQLRHTSEQLQASKARLTDLDDYIEIITQVLCQPEQHLQGRQFSVRLNKMNIKLGEQAAQAGETLQLTEISLGDRIRRVMLLVTFPRRDLLPEKDPLTEAMRILQ